MDEKSIKCFRCGAQPKILISMDIDQANIKLCPQCVADFGLFLQGHAVDRAICVKRGHYVRKEDEE